MWLLNLDLPCTRQESPPPSVLLLQSRNSSCLYIFAWGCHIWQCLGGPYGVAGINPRWPCARPCSSSFIPVLIVLAFLPSPTTRARVEPRNRRRPCTRPLGYVLGISVWHGVYSNPSTEPPRGSWDTLTSSGTLLQSWAELLRKAPGLRLGGLQDPAQTRDHLGSSWLGLLCVPGTHLTDGT